jgi:hypothetical protein
MALRLKMGDEGLVKYKAVDAAFPFNAGGEKELLSLRSSRLRAPNSGSRLPPISRPEASMIF